MLVDLPGVKRKDPDYGFFRNVSGAVSLIRKGLIATAAGDHGSINFYIDDDKNYCCELQRYLIIKDIKIYKKQKDAVAWLKENLTSIY